MSPPVTATSLLLSGRRAARWSTGAEALDALLTPTTAASSGFAFGQMVEIIGAPGEGKTRMCISLAVRCRLSLQDAKGEEPENEGREVLVVGKSTDPLVRRRIFLTEPQFSADTEGGISASRLYVAAVEITGSQGMAADSTKRKYHDPCALQNRRGVFVAVSTLYELVQGLIFRPSYILSPKF
jgi:RecA/RadA recombinase